MPFVFTADCSSTRHETKAQSWRDSSGICMYAPGMSCPADATCNPPPPTKIDCPDDLTQLDWDHWKAQLGRVENGTCVETQAPICAKDKEICDEQPPVPVSCPDDLTKLAFDRYVPTKNNETEVTTRIVRRQNGTCWEQEEGNCPPNVPCNPPAPRPIDCPEDPEQIDLDLFRPEAPETK